ncbi:MAG: NAD(P)/FAD-dependent oxidoreductase [Phycisphaerales bacterium]
MRIAVVGGGISGLVAANALSRGHEVVVFERDTRLGGHTNTIEVRESGRAIPVDTGFIVFNDRTYPNFIALMNRLGVPSRQSEMSFSVRCERTGLEYNGTSVRSLFSQKRNAVSPAFLRMIAEILRFNREAPAAVGGEADQTLGEYLSRGKYSRYFQEYYIVPMGAAIWSAPAAAMLSFPLRFFVSFFKNHGMLSVGDRPVWRTIVGGSNSYLKPLCEPFRDRALLGAEVTGIARAAESVRVRWRQDGAEERADSFDHVVLACHADQAARMLEDPSDAERDVLGAMPFQENEAILHTDASVMPKRKLAWAAWNYHVPQTPTERVSVTYNMNILQGIDSERQYCVTLNRADLIDPQKVIRRITYHHPRYTLAGVAARARWAEISGPRRTHYCGAYWLNGFHEDGVNSALRVCAALGESL